MKWEEIEIYNEKNELVKAQAPVIISASRSTDIPAFYSDWFIHRIKEGYLKWKNPFNGKYTYISFNNTRVIVFWSKNPKPIIKSLDYLDRKGINYYFQYTLNDYENEGFEKNVPSLSERLDTFRELSDKIGKDKVIWRFDPLILTEQNDVNELLKKIEKIGDELYKYTSKLVFSFADISIYKKVQYNMNKENVNYVEFTPELMIEFSKGLNKLNKKWGLNIATCAEKIGLEEYGIEHNKCIDDDLMIKLFSDDIDLMEFLGVEFEQQQPTLFSGQNKKILKNKDNKDKGQRIACGCIISKDIGEYNTCPHECVYCYANASKEIALKNYEHHKSNQFFETITGK